MTGIGEGARHATATSNAGGTGAGFGGVGFRAGQSHPAGHGERTRRAGQISGLRHRLRRLPHAEDDDRHGAEVGSIAVPRRASGRRVAGAAAPAGRRSLGLGERLGHDGLGRPVGSELFREPHSGREHGHRELVGGDLRGRTADGPAHGRLAPDPAPDAVGRLPELQRRGPALDLRVSEDGAAGEEPRPGAAAATRRTVISRRPRHGATRSPSNRGATAGRRG